MSTEKLPVTVITGFLGAGKTTLLNRILTQDHGKKYAVIINEFGEEGIDNDLVVDSDEEIFEMNNGCICCTVRGDLIRIISTLLKRSEQLDGMIIETTGLADPAPVVQTFFVDDDVKERVKLDAVITVVDAKHCHEHLQDSHEAEEQIAFADVIVVNKTDLVNDSELAAVREQIGKLNRYAKIHPVMQSNIDINKVLDCGAFDLQRILDIEPQLLEDEDDHEHDESITSVSLKTLKPLVPEKFSQWIREFIMQRGVDILRSKGILNLADQENRYVFQGVHMVMDSSWGEPWGEKARQSRLVFIGRNLDEKALREDFLACTQS
ncbi:MAG: GTP-binding protein [Cellvibrionaceae bacterium]|nr:GTP-binding protein [Cellvibrionaceae bacterium]